MKNKYFFSLVAIFVVYVFSIGIISAESVSSPSQGTIPTSNLELSFNNDNGNIDIDLQDIENSDININIDEDFMFSNIDIDINSQVSLEDSVNYGIFCKDKKYKDCKDNIKTISGFFSARNAPFELLKGKCAQRPVLLFRDLKQGQKLKIDEITGVTCALVSDHYGQVCINNRNEKCIGKIRCATNGGIKVGFFDETGKRRRIVEYSITKAREGIEVPEGATSAYIYFRERNSNKDWYFDNNSGDKCRFEASLISDY